MMDSMNGLPYASDDSTVKPSAQQTAPQAPAGAVSVGKERESGPYGVSAEKSYLTEVGREPELPKEVVAAGVRQNPAAVPVPKQAASMGVKPAGQNVVAASGRSVTLPLTDAQIAQGLRVGITSSWRWMAEWCARKLKQMHVGLRAVGGSIVRVRQ